MSNFKSRVYGSRLQRSRASVNILQSHLALGYLLHECSLAYLLQKNCIFMTHIKNIKLDTRHVLLLGKLAMTGDYVESFFERSRR